MRSATSSSKLLQFLLLFASFLTFHKTWGYVHNETTKHKVIRNKCYDTITDRYVNKGEMVQTNAGECSAEFCDGTTRDKRTGKMVSKFYNQGCREHTRRARPHCELKPANKSAPYPQCCPSFDCGPEEERCYLKETDTFYKPGYHVDPHNCIILNCVERLNRRSGRKTMNLVILGCSPVQLEPSDTNCWIERGNMTRRYPGCCDQIVCSEEDSSEE